ncbi:MAG: hypothetical protein LBI05_10930 [Planctomycetaceae bacterium]|nr:hypothetical protein [Planctomycetaceae bacterium]
MYSEKIQLAILDEVNQKSDGKNPVEIDLTDPGRKFNFRELINKECFWFFTDKTIKTESDYMSASRRVPTALGGLSEKGHKYRYDLAKELDREQWEREQHARDRARFRLDIIAVITSLVALALSVVSLIRS